MTPDPLYTGVARKQLIAEIIKWTDRCEELDRRCGELKFQCDKKLTEMAGIVTQTAGENKKLKQAIQQLGEVIAHL